jgi:Ran GTPase-activating protein (RanGAP) involved in mRNA processing and transport
MGLCRWRPGPDEARLLQLVLCNIPSFQSLDLASNYLRSAGLAELAPALYHNTSIKVLDISKNGLGGIVCVRLLRDLLRSNKTVTTLDLTGNTFVLTTGAVECIADELGSSSTLLKVKLSSCCLRDEDASVQAQTLGYRKKTLQKLALGGNSITYTGVSVLLDMMVQNSHHITYLDLRRNPIGNEGASLLSIQLSGKECVAKPPTPLFL